LLNDFSSYLMNDGKNEKTVQAYIPIIKSLSRWYANTTGEEFTPEAITVLDLKDWVSFLKTNKKFSQATINKYDLYWLKYALHSAPFFQYVRSPTDSGRSRK
jgi:hypothetical protein